MKFIKKIMLSILIAGSMVSIAFGMKRDVDDLSGRDDSHGPSFKREKEDGQVTCAAAAPQVAEEDDELMQAILREIEGLNLEEDEGLEEAIQKMFKLNLHETAELDEFNKETKCFDVNVYWQFKEVIIRLFKLRQACPAARGTLTTQGIARILLNKGLDVMNYRSCTVLHNLLFDNNLHRSMCGVEADVSTEEVVSILLEAAQNPVKRAELVMAEDISSSRFTLLHHAAEQCISVEIVKMLLDAVRNPIQRAEFLQKTAFVNYDVGHVTALQYAVYLALHTLGGPSGYIDLIGLLLEYYKTLGIEIPQDLLPQLQKLGLLK